MRTYGLVVLLVGTFLIVPATAEAKKASRRAGAGRSVAAASKSRARTLDGQTRIRVAAVEQIDDDEVPGSRLRK